MRAAWKPRIFRAWSTRLGVFYWSFTRPKANVWASEQLAEARVLEGRAAWFCRQQNMKEGLK